MCSLPPSTINAFVYCFKRQVTMTSSTVNLALVFFGGIVVVLHLRRKIRSVHLATKREDWVVVQRNSGAGQKQVLDREGKRGDLKYEFIRL